VKIISWKPGTIPKAGKCYSGVPNMEYHSLKEWYSSSMIKHALRSAESFFYEINEPSKNSLALECGTAFHIGMEGLAVSGHMDLFDSEVMECPTATITSKACGALKAENSEKAVLPAPEIEKTREMAEKLYFKTRELNYFDEGYPELSFFWIDQETGLRLKCKIDWFRPDEGGWILDHKSTKAHQYESFKKEIANRNYHLSAAMYREGVKQVTGLELEDDHYHLLVIANTAPHEVEVYPLDAPSMTEGHALFRKCLSVIKNYDPEADVIPRTIGLPQWAFKLTS